MEKAEVGNRNSELGNRKLLTSDFRFPASDFRRQGTKAMDSRKAISLTAALALAAGILSVPGGTFARGAGGFAAHGPVFGFHPRVGGHRPFRPALVHRVPARFGWQLRWWNHRV